MGERGTARAEFEEEVPCEALILQVLNLIWRELVSHGGQFVQPGLLQRALTVSGLGHRSRLDGTPVDSAVAPVRPGDTIEGQWSYLNVPRSGFGMAQTAGSRCR